MVSWTNTITLFYFLKTVFIVFVVTVSQMGSLIAIDHNINSVCVLLMSALHSDLYYKLCTPCHNRFGKCSTYQCCASG